MMVVSLKQLARELRVPARWLKGEADAGRIPAIRAGAGRYLLQPEAVRKALADRAATSFVTPSETAVRA